MYLHKYYNTIFKGVHKLFIKMNSGDFIQVLSSIKMMNKNQLNLLFQEMEKQMNVDIPLVLSRDDIDNTLSENMKEPLTDDEWLKFQESMCDASTMLEIVDDFAELKYSVLSDIRPDWNDWNES